MYPKSKGHTWPSTSQTMEFNQVLATEWLFEFWAHPEEYPGGVNSAGLSNLAEVGKILVNIVNDRLLLVLAKGRFAFVGWDLSLMKGDSSQSDNNLSTFQLERHSCLSFQYITNLQDWLVVPSKPILAGQKGPLCLQQTGQAMEIPYALLESGLQLTCEQLKQILKHFEVQFKGNASRKELQHLLIDALLEEGEERNSAKQKPAQQSILCGFPGSLLSEQ